MRQKSFHQTTTGVLYLVPTPIGNLEDMTFRAINTLQSVHLILSEDTRHTQKLLNHFHIQTPQKSFHEHNTQMRIPQVLEWLLSGKNIAQVSDAGTPSISDPGFELVQACIQAGIAVIPLPGANAGITALIASGLVPQPFYFYGFLPRKKKERLSVLTQLSAQQETVIIYESPYRLKECFANIVEVYGDQQTVVLCRELTKTHEEFIRGTAKELLDLVTTEALKGECCILIGSTSLVDTPLHSSSDDWEAMKDLTLEEQVEWLITQQQMSQKDAIKQVAKQNNLKKQMVYKLIHTKN